MNTKREMASIFACLCFILLGILMPQSGALAQTCVPPAPGLEGWWPADGNADDIQSGNDGVLQAGVAFPPGFVLSGTGQAFSFDGIDDFLFIPDAPQVNPSTAMTLAAWIFPDTLSSFRGNRIISKDQILSGDRDYGFKIDFQKRLEIGAYNAGGSQFILSGGTLQTGAWQHVATTMDIVNGVIRVYIDGIEAASRSDFVGSGLRDSGAPVDIGKFSSELPPFWNEFFDGLIDEVQIFSRALDADEIMDIFNAGAAGVCRAPAESIAQLKNEVIALGLPSGITQRLTKKLDCALRVLEDANGNNDVVAVNAILAFIHKVEAQRGKKIPEADADGLIAFALVIIELIQGN